MSKIVESHYLESKYNNRDKLFTHFKAHMTARKLLLDRNADKYLRYSVRFLIIATLGLLIGVPLFLIYMSAIYFIIIFLVVIFCFLMSLLFASKSVKASNEYIISKYPYYRNLIIKKPKTYSKEVLTALRCDEIYKNINTWEIKYIDIDDLIEYYDVKGEDLKNSKWYPITLWSLIIFPVYGEFIASLYSKTTTVIASSVLFLVLIFLGTILFWFINKFRLIISAFLLFESDNYKELVDILKIIKTFPKS
ncbi:hypothetical protein ACI2LM_18215 [Paenibacillus lautus]|uniref:hypothetical protein n=1 Tax=Paenibacillus lautus TaxID=1401 RepID=UPI00384ADC0A